MSARLKIEGSFVMKLIVDTKKNVMVSREPVEKADERGARRRDGQAQPVPGQGR
jgi:hypothetical protein